MTEREYIARCETASGQGHRRSVIRRAWDEDGTPRYGWMPRDEIIYRSGISRTTLRRMVDDGVAETRGHGRSREYRMMPFDRERERDMSSLEDTIAAIELSIEALTAALAVIRG